jgi:hypothetical protein
MAWDKDSGMLVFWINGALRNIEIHFRYILHNFQSCRQHLVPVCGMRIIVICYLLNDAVSNSDCTAWIMNWNEYGRKRSWPNLRYYLAFTWKGWGEEGIAVSSSRGGHANHLCTVSTLVWYMYLDQFLLFPSTYRGPSGDHGRVLWNIFETPFSIWAPGTVVRWGTMLQAGRP